MPAMTNKAIPRPRNGRARIPFTTLSMPKVIESVNAINTLPKPLPIPYLHNLLTLFSDQLAIRKEAYRLNRLRLEWLLKLS